MSKKDRGRLQKPRVCDMEQKQLTYHTPLKKSDFRNSLSDKHIFYTLCCENYHTLRKSH